MLKSMRNFEFVRNEIVISDIPRIIRTNEISDNSNTILDPEFEQDGAEIDLPSFIGEVETLSGGKSKKIIIPPCPHSRQEGFIIIDDIAMRVNNMLRVLLTCSEGNAKAIANFHTSFHRYQMAIYNKIIGKDGVICRDVLGTRIMGSGRGVIVPQQGDNPDQVYLPHEMMCKMSLIEGDYVILGRDPVIHDGSVEVLQATGWFSNAIGVHPMWFKQMGADCDGDTVFVIKVPVTLDSQLIASKYVARRMSKVSYPEVKVHDHTSTVSPMDIINNTENIARFVARTGKNVAAEALRISKGLSSNEINDYRLLMNEVMLIQKIYMGPTGSVANKIKMMSSHHPELIASANYISERIQQSLFDHKGAVGITGDNRDIFDLLDVMRFKGKYSTLDSRHVTNHRQAIDRLVAHGLDKQRVAPVITWIYTVWHMLKSTSFPSKEMRECAMKMCDPDVACDRQKCSDIMSTFIMMAKQNENYQLGDYSGKFMTRFIDSKKSASLSQILDNIWYSVINEAPKSGEMLESTLFLVKEKLDNKYKNERSVPDQLFNIVLESHNVARKSSEVDGAALGFLDQHQVVGKTD